MTETHTVLSVLLRVARRTDNTHLHVTVALSTGVMKEFSQEDKFATTDRKRVKRKSVSGCV